MNPAAVAVVRAAALRHNLQRVRELAPGCRLLAVIKANAYGHGLVAVARILDAADGFAVARLEEAIQLRDAGISKKIVLLGGFISTGEVQVLQRYGLDTVVHCQEQIEMLLNQPGVTPIEVWLKVDTGMGRLGVEPAAVGASVASLRGRVRSLRVMTHLASADCPDEAAATSEQLECFSRSIGQWSGDVSIANSATILRWPQALRRSAQLNYRGDNWVRPGLMLYGVSPLPEETPRSLGLKPAMSFETRLMAIRLIKRGGRVGYGGDWCAQRDSLIGIAAAGYADGYPWHIADGTPALVNGCIAPVVGRVSMDMITIDLTGLRAPRLGDPVVLWGDEPTVTTVADKAGTIAYELLAGMSPRVVRQVAA